MATQALPERSTRSRSRQPIHRRLAPATRARNLTDPRGREVLARRSLSLAIRRAEQTYALAARRLSEFDLYLEGVHRRLYAEGYLSAEARLDAGHIEQKGAER